MSKQQQKQLIRPQSQQKGQSIPSSQQPGHMAFFLKYSDLRSGPQRSPQNIYLPHEQLDQLAHHQYSNQVSSQEPVGDNAIHQQQPEHNHSLIESVDKEQFLHESQSQLQNSNDLPYIPQASSKIIHQLNIKQQSNPNLQYQNYNPSNINQQQIVGTNGNLNQNPHFVQQNNPRQTIATGQSPIYRTNREVVSGQNLNMRGSLPPNLNPSMYTNTPRQSMISQGQQVRQPQQIRQIQQPMPYQQQPIQPVNIFPQQQIRVPQHMPQNLIVPQKVESQTLFQPVDFTHGGPHRLQTSEIVYRDRNPNENIQSKVMSGLQRDSQVQQPRIGSIEMGRENTRSMERKRTNIVFNYNAQGSIQPVSSVQSQIITPTPGSTIQQRPDTFAPLQVNPMPKELNVKSSPVQLPPQQNVSHSPQHAQTSTPSIPTQIKTEQKIQWKERYFALYSQLSSVNKKVEIINEEFYIYDKVISSTKDDKVTKKHHKIQRILQQLQQQCTSITHEWKPTSDTKIPPIIQQQKLYSHLETKYKRLLFNFSKLQEENAEMKKKFEEQINQVVVKLEKENETLKSKLAMIPEIKGPSMSMGQSDDLTLSASLKEEMQENIARYYQQNMLLKSEVERVTEKNEKLMDIIKQLQSEEKNVRGKEVDTQNIEEIIQGLNHKLIQYQDRLVEFEKENKHLIAKNQQLHQLIQNQQQQKNQQQTNPSQYDSNQQVTLLQQQLKSTILQLQAKTKELQGKTRYFQYLEASCNSLQQENLKIGDQAQQLTDQVAKLKIQLQQAKLKNTQKNTQHQHQSIKVQEASKPHVQLEEINIQLQQKLNQIQTLKEQIIKEQNTSSLLTQQLGKVKSKVADLQSQLHEVQNQLQSSQQHTQERHSPQLQDNHDLNSKIQHLQEQNSRISQYQAQNNKLHQQNISLRDELQRLNQKVSSSQTHLNQYKTQINRYQTQLQDYQTQPSSIQAPSQSPLMIQQYEFTISTLRSEISRKETEIERQSRLSDQRILDLTEQLKLSYKEREGLHKKFQEKSHLLEGERQKKEILIRELRDKIYELQHRKRLDEQQEKRRHKYQGELQTTNQNKQITRLNIELQTVKSQKDKAQKDHQAQSKRLLEQLNQLNQQTTHLKRQVSDLSSSVSELETMTEALNKKNMEILQLKSISFQNEKLQIENSNLKKQVERQFQEGIKIAAEYDKLNKTYVQLNRDMKQTESNLNVITNKFTLLQTEHNSILELQAKKDQELAKLRQSTQVLQGHLEEAEKQCDKAKTKVRNLEAMLQQQTTALREQIEDLRTKMSDYDTLVRDKALSEHKIIELQNCKQKYEYQLRQNQELLTKQKSKIKTLESQNEDLTQQIETLNQKTKQQQKKISQTSKKYKKMIEDLQQKNKSLQEKHAKIEKEKITQLENDIKTRENKIWKLQKQLQEAMQRLDDMGDQQMAWQKIQYLEQKVKEYESRLFNQAFKFSPTSYDHEASKVFERQVIYQLQQENQRLKEFISHKKSIKPTHDKNVEASNEEMKEAYDDGLDEVQGRLNTFNTKLQSLIKHGSYQNIQIPSKKSRLSPAKTQQVKTQNTLSTIKVAQAQLSTRQLRELKLKYSQLQRYCKNIQIQLLSGKTTTTKKTVTTGNIALTSTNQTIINDQLNFHKEKNKQLQERVDKLLKMNTQLKSNMEILLQQRNQSSSVTYYKEQLTELNEKNVLLEVRVKKLLQENQKLKTQLGTSSRSQQSSEVRAFQFQRKNIELQRAINELSMIKSSLQKELQSRTQLLQSKQQEINELRNHLSLSGEKQSVVVLSLKQQIENYESEVTKLSNRIRISESEIERLNESLRKSKSESVEEVGRWRLKVGQVQEELARLSGDFQKEGNAQASLKYELSHWMQQLKAAQFQNQQLKQTIQNLTRKLQQSESKLRELRYQQQEVQNELSTKSMGQQQLLMRIEYQESQLTKLRYQLDIISQQNGKINEQSRHKQRNSEIQIQSLQEKLSSTQRDLLNLRKFISSLEDEKKACEEQLSKSQFQVTMLFKDFQQKERDYFNKQAIYEDKIIMLKTQITAMESTSASLHQSMTAMNTLRQKYDMQIVELRNQVSLLRSEIERLKEMLRDKDLINQQLQQEYSLLDEQRSKQQAEIINLLNQSGVMKNEIERLTSTIGEKDSSLVSAMGNSVTLGMEVNSYIAQITALRQENESLTQKIRQLQNSTTFHINNLNSEIIILKRENEDLKQEVENFKSQKEDFEQQLTQWMNRVSLLGQQNKRLSQMTQHLQSASSLSTQVGALRQQNHDLRSQLGGVHQQLQVLVQEYQSKTSYMQQNIASISYFVEMSRSIYLEIQALVEQQDYSSPEERMQLRVRTVEDLQKGLRSVKEMSDVLTGMAYELSTKFYHHNQVEV